MASLDGALSASPLYFRMIVTVPVATILAEPVARCMGQPSFDVHVGIAGAGPAAACSWLSASSNATVTEVGGIK
jgi:hypothetical protein